MKSNNPIQLVDAFFRKPLLIEESALRMILAALNVSAASPVPQAAYGGSRSGNVITIKSEVAVIPVLNILSYRSLDYWSYLFSDTTYQQIRANFRQALGDNTVSAIVLDVASPGGTSEGLFDLVDEIYQSRGVKPIYSMINESACSAAYAIASAADKVYLPRTGAVGSIGVRAVHIDESAAEEMAGLKYTEIYAGARKIDGTPHAPLTDEARAIYQKVCDQIQDLFVETTARNRGLKPADVRAQQAAIFYGKEAVSAGLADAVLSWEGAWKKIIGSKTNQGGSNMKTKLQALFTEGQEAVVQALGELGYVAKPEQGAIVLPAASIPVVAAALGLTTEQLAGDLSKVDFKASQEQVIQATRDQTKKETLAYVESIHEVCSLGGQETMAIGLIKSQTKLEDARAKVLAAKAGEAGRTQIRSTIGGMSADGVNPLLEDAKKRSVAATAKM